MSPTFDREALLETGLYSSRQLTRLEDSKQLASICFAILTPDALHRAIETLIFDTLVQQGFDLLKYRVLYMDDRGVESLYRHGFHQKLTAGQPTHWFMTRQGLTLGPSVGMLLLDRQGDGPRRLTRVKGSLQQPRESVAQDSIRAQIGAFSKVLALIHSSDDSTSALREARLYFDAEETLGTYISPRAIPWSDIERALTPTKPNSNPLEIHRAVLMRCLSKLEAQAGAWAKLAREALIACEIFTPPETSSWQASRSDWATVLDVVKSKLTFANLVGEIGRLGQPDNSPGDLALLSEIHLAYIVRDLSTQDKYNQLNFDAMTKALRALHIPLSNWESIVIGQLLNFWNHEGW